MRTVAWVALAILLAAGCAAPLVTSTVVRDPKFNYSATEAKAVKIYATPPAAEYEVIGEVRTRVAASVPMDQVEASLKEEAAKIGANGVVTVVKDVYTEQKVKRPTAAQQPIGTTGGGGGVAVPGTARTEEVTIPIHEKEITGVVIRFKK